MNRPSISFTQAGLIVVLVLFVSTVLVGCSQSSTGTIPDATLSAYSNMQEHLIDQEEGLRTNLRENQQLQTNAQALQVQLSNLTSEIEQKTQQNSFVQERPAVPDRLSLPHPKARIQEGQIDVMQTRTVLDVSNVYKWYVLNTKSMSPLLDVGTNVLTVSPKTQTDIQVGDIIVFKATWSVVPIVHRVIQVGTDAQGVYYKTKGDNNPDPDPGYTRFSDVNSVVVGILY